MIMKRVKVNRGSALILGVGVMMLLGLLLTALFPWMTAESRFAAMEQYAVQARYAAESGAKHAYFVDLKKSPPIWTLFNTDTAFLNNSLYRVELTTVDGTLTSAPPTVNGQYFIRATGSSRGVARQAKLSVNIDVYGNPGVYIGGNLTIGLGHSGTETGTSVISSGHAKQKNRDTLPPGIFGDYPPVEDPYDFSSVTFNFPTDTPAGTAVPLPAADKSGVYLESGLYKVGGAGTLLPDNKKIDYKISGTGKTVGIYIPGNLGDSNTTETTFDAGDPSNNLLVFVEGDFLAKGQVTINNAVLIVKGSFTQELNNMDVTGLIIVDDDNALTTTGNNLTIGNNFTVSYRQDALARMGSLGLTLPSTWSTPFTNITGIDHWEK